MSVTVAVTKQTVTIDDGRQTVVVTPVTQTVSVTSPGPQGATGPTVVSVAVGTTTTGAAGSNASVANSGTNTSAILDFTIPRGNTGATGPAGSAATIAVGTVTTGTAGSNATVTNVGTSGAAIFDFSIPRGDKGETGATGSTGATGQKGDKGDTGSAGSAATIAVGTVTQGTAVSVTNSGSSSAAVFDFVLVKGDKGDTGATGSTGPQGPSGVVSVNAPLTDSGTSGSANISIGTAALSGVYGVTTLVDSTSSSSTTTAAVPNSVKSAYDLASAAIPKSIATTAGDVIYASGSATFVRLGIGTATQVLTVGTAGAPEWANPTGGGGGGAINAVTGTSPISVVTTSGTAAVSIATGSTSAVGALQLTDSSQSTSTTTAATPNAVLQSTKDIQANFYASTTRIGNVPNWTISGGFGETSGRVNFTKHIPERNFTVSNLSFITGATAASGLTLCRFGIYTRSGTTFTLVARTASDTTIFNATNTRFTRALNTTGGYPATYDFVAGSEYWVAVIEVGTTMASILSGVSGSTATQNAFTSFVYTATGQTDLPTSVTGTVATLRTYSEVS